MSLPLDLVVSCLVHANYKKSFLKLLCRDSDKMAQLFDYFSTIRYDALTNKLLLDSLRSCLANNKDIYNKFVEGHLRILCRFTTMDIVGDIFYSKYIFVVTNEKLSIKHLEHIDRYDITGQFYLISAGAKVKMSKKTCINICDFVIGNAEFYSSFLSQSKVLTRLMYQYNLLM